MSDAVNVDIWFLGKAARHQAIGWRRLVQANWVFACKEVKVWTVGREGSI